MEQYEFFKGLYNKHFNTNEWLVRNGNEYAVKNVVFYFPNYSELKIQVEDFDVEVTITETSVTFSGESSKLNKLYDWCVKNEEKIVENVQAQMTEQLFFGAQLLQEERENRD